MEFILGMALGTLLTLFGAALGGFAVIFYLVSRRKNEEGSALDEEGERGLTRSDDEN